MSSSNSDSDYSESSGIVHNDSSEDSEQESDALEEESDALEEESEAPEESEEESEEESDALEEESEIKTNLRRYLLKRAYERVLERYRQFRPHGTHAKDSGFIRMLHRESRSAKRLDSDIPGELAQAFTKSMLARIANELQEYLRVPQHASIDEYLQGRVAAYGRLKAIRSDDEARASLMAKEDRVLVRQLITEWTQYLSKKEELVGALGDLSTEDKQVCLATLRKSIGTKRTPMLLRIMNQKTTLSNRNKILAVFKKCSQAPDSTKHRAWVEEACKIPFGILHADGGAPSPMPAEVLQRSSEAMDESVYGHDRAKRTILQVLAQTLSNPSSGETSMIALSGPPGIGKTTLIKNGVAKALGRPFRLISLGGARDISLLKGHGFTYEGSMCGKIVEVLQECKCMDPVILFDEVDKISDTPRGQEITNALIHIIDRAQNSAFQDRYFSGLNIDLSRVTFLFSLNDPSRLNPILRDRMEIIPLKGFTDLEKKSISRHSLWEEAVRAVGMSGKLSITDEVLGKIISMYDYESGVRKLKGILLEITRAMNLRRYQTQGNPQSNPKKRRKRNLPKKTTKTPQRITFALVQEILRDRYVVVRTKVRATPQLGEVNGMWANSSGKGGILPIQVRVVPTSKKLELLLTGNQGKVMRESMHCAVTLAWAMLSPQLKRRWTEKWKRSGPTGFHIHCPDNATPKDGPSAGAAITVCIMSTLTGHLIDNYLAMTGEIALSGHVGMIGGLHEKLRGAKDAGVRRVLAPRENARDLELIKRRDPDLLGTGDLTVTFVDTITDVMRHVQKPNLAECKGKGKGKRKRAAPSSMQSGISRSFVVTN